MRLLTVLKLLALPAVSAIVFVIVLTTAPAVNAKLPASVLDGVSVEPQVGAQLPLSARFIDDTGASQTLGAALGGRPAVLIFADYTCRTLCGPILDFATAGLEKSGLEPSADYRLIVIGLDPKNGLAEVRAMRSSHLGTASPVANATTMLIGDQAAIEAVTRVAGYHYVYDTEYDQFAHPAAAYVITAAGRIARVLSGLGLDGNDLRLALVDAGEGLIGTFTDRIRLLCYGFDPAHGVYTASIERLLMVATVLTMIALAGWLFLLVRLSHGSAR
jgi:protein SCO1